MLPESQPAFPEPMVETLLRPTSGWAGLNLSELWAYRELLAFFVWRDLKVQYKQTAFGALWAVIQPVMLMLVFSLFLGRLGGIAPPDVPYSLFALAGLVPWLLFAKSLASSADSLVSAANLIQKVYFPRLLLPLAALGSHLLDYLIALIVLIVVGLGLGFAPSATIIWIVPLTALTLTVALAAGVWLSAAYVRYRDVRQLIPFLIQLWLFASPVAYSSSLVPTQWIWLYRLNPMANVIEGFRWAMFGVGVPPPAGEVLGSAIATVGVLLAGLAYFRRVERTFADAI